MKMKKISAFIVALALITLALASCGGGIKYEDVDYREKGLSFTLPSSMRRSTVTDHDFEFSTLDAVFYADKVDYETVSEAGVEISESFDAEEYAIAITKTFDQDQLYFEEDKENMRYSFRYTYGDTEAGESETFFYVVVIGEVGNVWYIEMICEQELSADYIPTFELWEKSIKTYME